MKSAELESPVDWGRKHLVAVAVGLALCACGPAATTGSGPAPALPSWSDGPTRDAVVSFVTDITTSE